MATRDELMQMLRNAHNAGDTEAARRFVQMIDRLDAQPTEQPSLARRIWGNVVGDDDPTTQNLGEKIGTALNTAGEAMTFGLVGDETSAAVESVLPGVDYDARRDHYRAQEGLLRETNPGAALTAEIGGGIAGALSPAGAIGTAARGTGAVSRVARSMAAGAAGGATYGAMEGEGGVENRVADAQDGVLYGAVGGAVAPALGSVVRRVGDALLRGGAVRSAARGAPTSQELRNQAQEAYQAVDDAGVSIRPDAFNRLQSQMAATLSENGLDELPGPGSLTPGAARLNQIGGQMAAQMAEEPTASLPLSSVDQLRRHAGTVAASPNNRTDAALGARAIGTIDDFVQELSEADIDAGDIRLVQEMLPRARELYSRMSRSLLVDDAIENAENYVSGPASGLRNQFRRILSNDRLNRGFSQAELDMMRRVVNGSFPERLLNLLGGGLGQMGQIGVGAGLGGVPGALVGTATAAGTRAASEAVVGRNAEIVRRVIANGGLAEAPVQNDQTRALVEELLRRQMIMSQQN